MHAEEAEEDCSAPCHQAQAPDPVLPLAGIWGVCGGGEPDEESSLSTLEKKFVQLELGRNHPFLTKRGNPQVVGRRQGSRGGRGEAALLPSCSQDRLSTGNPWKSTSCLLCIPPLLPSLVFLIIHKSRRWLLDPGEPEERPTQPRPSAVRWHLVPNHLWMDVAQGSLDRSACHVSCLPPGD